MALVHSFDVPLAVLLAPLSGSVPWEEQADALELAAWAREARAEVEERDAGRYEITVEEWRAAEGWSDVDLDALPGRAVAEVEAMLARPARLGDAALIAGIDLSLGSPLFRLRLSKRLDEVAAMVAARQAEVLASVAGPTGSGSYLDEVHVETEVALARGISPAQAGWDITIARSLASEFPAFGDALARGEISVGHCRKLIEVTGSIPDRDVAARIAELALPKAKNRTVPLFAQALRRLVARYDRDAVARRAQAVRDRRDVSVRRLDDGLGQLVYTDEWTKVAAVERRIRTAGRATQMARKRDAAAEKARAAGLERPDQGNEKTRAKQARKIAASVHHSQDGWQDSHLAAADCRADALLAIVLGREQDDGSIVLDTTADIRVNVEVVMDLETLRGEADNMALLDGQPVPAEVGREWAEHARTFRRMVTDPVTGHLLDRGKQYMAADVRDFVLARDGGCRVPVCGIQHKDRLQADHAIPAPDGDTTSANLGALSTTHHQLKTEGYLDIENSMADGSGILTTLWGQRIVIPPRAYLDEPGPEGWDRNAKRWDWDAPPPF